MGNEDRPWDSSSLWQGRGTRPQDSVHVTCPVCSWFKKWACHANVRMSLTAWSAYSFLSYLSFLLLDILWSIDVANGNERPAQCKRERDPVRASGMREPARASSGALHRQFRKTVRSDEERRPVLVRLAVGDSMSWCDAVKNYEVIRIHWSTSRILEMHSKK